MFPSRARSFLLAMPMLLLFAFIACDGDDSTGGTQDGGTLESGPTGETGPTPTPANDAAGDVASDVGSDVDGAPPVVVVVTDYANQPLVVEVVFHRPDGTTETKTTSANDGKASMVVPDGSSVTVFSGTTSAQGGLFATVMGVGPGDTVPFQLVEPAKKDAIVAAVDYTAGDAGAYDYFAWPCNWHISLPAPPATATWSVDHCRDKNGNVPVLYAAQVDDVVGDIRAWATKTTPFTSSAGFSAPMVAANEWQDAPAPNKLTVSGTPADGGAVNVRAEMSFLHDNIRFDPFAFGTMSASTLPQERSFVIAPPAFFPFVEHRFELFEIGGRRTVLKRSANAAADVAMSIDDVLPKVTGVTATGTKDAPQVTYTADGSLASAQGVFVLLFAEGPDGDGGSIDLTWSIRSFGATGALTPPKLNAAQLARVPGANWTDGTLAIVSHDGATTAQAFATRGMVIDFAPNATANFVLPEGAVTVKTSRRNFNF